MLHPQVLLVPLQALLLPLEVLLVPLQALLVPLQALPGPELEPQLLALLRVPRELLVLVETLALPQLPLALGLRCLLLGPLDSLRQLHLQERLDLPLGNRRTC